MLEGYQTDLELSDLVVSDQLAVEVPQIEIYGEQGPEIAIEDADVDSSVIGVSEDRVGEEYEITDISITSLIEGAKIARTAASLGVVISAEQALRAGQIRSGEVTVGPECRDNGRKTNNNLQQHEEATSEVPEVQKTDQFLSDELTTAVAEEEPLDTEKVQPTALSVPSDHVGNEEDSSESITEEIAEQDVDLAVQPSSGDGGDKPPIDPTPGETGFPDDENPGPESGDDRAESSSPQQYFAPGQLRSTIRDMTEVLAEAGVEVDAMLTPKQREALLLLLGEMSNDEIATQLEQRPSSISKMSHLIVERMIAQAPEKLDLQALAQPAGHIVPEEPNTSVGAMLNVIREQKGITIDSLIEQLEVSRSAVQRFFAGTARPHNTQMILPLLEILGVPEEEASAYLQAYRTERMQRTDQSKDNEV